MIDVSLILDALRREPVYYGDRAMPEEERLGALRLEAEAIAENARTLLEAAELIALARHESGHASYVILGHCSEGPRGARCDNGRSRTPWQLRSWCVGAWAVNESDPAALKAGARCAIRMLRYQAERGKEHALTPLRAAFAGYGARPWNWEGAAKREATTHTILRRLGGTP